MEKNKAHRYTTKNGTMPEIRPNVTKNGVSDKSNGGGMKRRRQKRRACSFEAEAVLIRRMMNRRCCHSCLAGGGAGWGGGGGMCRGVGGENATNEFARLSSSTSD